MYFELVGSYYKPIYKILFIFYTSILKFRSVTRISFLHD